MRGQAAQLVAERGGKADEEAEDQVDAVGNAGRVDSADSDTCETKTQTDVASTVEVAQDAVEAEPEL